MRGQSTITDDQSSAYGVCVLKDAPASLAAPVSNFKPHIDRGAMSVTAILTTRTPDRQGDIIDPAGGDFSEHETNPVVLFHHAKTHKLPIGKAEDRDGNYTVRLVKASDGDVLIGTTHFAQSNRFAQDVFGLVAEDILRGVSIGFDPLNDDDSVDELGPSPVLKRSALHFKGWKLLEYSHTPIGVNRDALTVAVQKALDGSRKLDPRLLAMLQPLTAPRKTVVAVTTNTAKTNPNGATVAKPAVTKSAVARIAKAPLAGADDEDDDRGESADQDGDASPGTDGGDTDPGEMDGDADDVGAMGGGKGDDFDPTADDPSADPNLPANTAGGGMDDEPPPTVQTLTDGAQGLMDLGAAIEQQMMKSEHMKGRKFAAKVIAELKATAGDMKRFADKIRAELSGSAGMTDDPDADGSDDASTAPGDDGDNADPKEPDTDEEGAIVTKGYHPRRWTFADEATQTLLAPVQAQTADPSRLKALERQVKQLAHENSELERMYNNLLEDNEAGTRRNR